MAKRDTAEDLVNIKVRNYHVNKAKKNAAEENDTRGREPEEYNQSQPILPLHYTRPLKHRYSQVKKKTYTLQHTKFSTQTQTIVLESNTS